MLFRDVFHTLSTYLFGLLLALIPPLLIAFYCEYIAGKNAFPESPSFWAFIFSMIVTAALGAIFRFLGRKASGHFYRREALLLIVVIYFLTSILGGLPFFLSQTLTNPVDAFFEATSGLTTTGATVLEGKKYSQTGLEQPIESTFSVGKEITYRYYGTIKPVLDPKTNVLLSGIEAVSPALLFWRSFMQWLGGCGIAVLFVAIFPALGVGGKVLYQSEVTGPTKESMAPRIKETASWLWKTYLGLTLLEILLLVMTNPQLPLFDAVTISFATISTGGFAPKNNGIAAYNSAATDWIVILFMLLGSLNFSLYFFLLKGKFRRLNDPELKAFLLIVFLSLLFATFQLVGEPKQLLIPENTSAFSLSEAFRYGTFQVVSAQTSTGFATANFDLWPFSIQALMLIVMFIGGMAGSTAGGMKVIRQLLAGRILQGKIETIFRPDTVRPYRLGKSMIGDQTAITILSFFTVVVSITVLGTFLLIIDGIDPETSLTTISSMANNVGIAFRVGGPIHSFAFLSNFGKILSSIWMIAGRLEYFALLVLLVPSFWKMH